MVSSKKISALRVADEAFLVSSMIERCPKTMMIRELFTNALEAVVSLSKGTIEFRSIEISGVRKLSIWNTGSGMSADELHRVCDIAASIGKEKGLDQNFGMGAKVASLPSNKFGMRYRSRKDGAVTELILGFRDGVYGRIVRQDPITGSDCTTIDVTAATDANILALNEDWTEVVLLGNKPDQNTVIDPYDGEPIVPKQWLADYLYHRYFRLPSCVQVRFGAGTHKLGDGYRTFKTISERAFPIGRHEAVTIDDRMTIHYFYDPPLANTTHNKSVSGAITSDISLCSVVYKHEMYDVRIKRQWSFDAPIFGVTFGAKHISIHIELHDKYPVRPEAYRQFLRRKDSDQSQVFAVEFADLVRENRPAWLIEIIQSLAPPDSDSASKIRDELQKLLNSLRLRTTSPRIRPEGDMLVDSGLGSGAGPGNLGKDAKGEGLKNRPTDLLAVPHGARSARLASNPERAPDLQYLTTVEQAEEKGIKGKAARFISETGQLFINLTYPSVLSMREQLESEYADATDIESMRRMAKAASEYTMVMRVGRAVIFAMAKRLNHEWTFDDMGRAQSPEALSLAADDYHDSMQNVRRRMGQALRASKQNNNKVYEPA